MDTSLSLVLASIFFLVGAGIIGGLNQERSVSIWGVLVALWLMLLAILAVLERILTAIT